MEIIAILLILSLLVGVLAAQWDRCGICWMLLSVLISPLLAGIILLIVGKKKQRHKERLA